MEKQDYSINVISMIFQNMDKCGLRLTKSELDLCEECTNGSLCKLLYNPCPAKLVYTKLSQYEDTGLAPEEVQIQKEAMESMGWFGKMFQRYKGDPRGPIGTLGTALGKSLALLIAESAKNRQPVKDVDGNAWLPMLLDEFESMADVIEHGQEWIPVKVRLPMPYENPVLVYDNSGVGMAWYSSKMGWVYRTGLGCVDITHWMPLPQPPKEEKK